MLEKFRIKVSEIIIINDFDELPKIWTRDKFDRIVKKFKAPEDKEAIKLHPNFYITDGELELLKHKVRQNSLLNHFVISSIIAGFFFLFLAELLYQFYKLVIFCSFSCFVLFFKLISSRR